MTSEHMKAALRVLKAISMRDEPDQSDIAILRDAVNPNERNLYPDEQACIIVQAALLRKKQAAVNGLACGGGV